jgi:hypothetical protein
VALASAEASEWSCSSKLLFSFVAGTAPIHQWSNPFPFRMRRNAQEVEEAVEEEAIRTKASGILV